MPDGKNVKDVKKAQDEGGEDRKGKEEIVNDGRIVEEDKKKSKPNDSNQKKAASPEKMDTTQLSAEENR